MQAISILDTNAVFSYQEQLKTQESPNRGRRCKEIAKKYFEKFENFWKMFVGKTLSGSRRVVKAIRYQMDPKSSTSKTVGLIAKRSKLTGVIGLPLSVYGYVKKAIGMDASRKKRDVESLAMETTEQIAGTLDIGDKIINLVDGICDLFSLSPAVEAHLSVASTVAGAFQTAAQSLFFGLAAYKIDRQRTVKEHIQLVTQHVDNEKFLLTFLNGWVGIPEGEKRSLTEKVDRMRRKKGWNTEKCAQEYKKRKHDRIAAKQRVIERGTTKKAASLMTAMRKSLKHEKNDFPVEKRREIVAEMRKMVHRNLAFQSVELVRCFAGFIGGLLILTVAINPAIGLLLVAAAIFTAIIMTLIRNYLLQRGMVHIKG